MTEPAATVNVPRALLLEVLETAEADSDMAENEFACSAADRAAYEAEREKIRELRRLETVVRPAQAIQPEWRVPDITSRARPVRDVCGVRRGVRAPAAGHSDYRSGQDVGWWNVEPVTPTATVHYGVRFYDGSVMHPWNGRTQEQRARERLAELRVTYPRDRFALVIRDGKDQPWKEADE